MRYLINDDDLLEWVKLLEEVIETHDTFHCSYIIQEIKNYMEQK